MTHTGPPPVTALEHRLLKLWLIFHGFSRRQQRYARSLSNPPDCGLDEVGGWTGQHRPCHLDLVGGGHPVGGYLRRSIADLEVPRVQFKGQPGHVSWKTRTSSGV
jgi:hypothetical protein